MCTRDNTPWIKILTSSLQVSILLAEGPHFVQKGLSSSHDMDQDHPLKLYVIILFMCVQGNPNRDQDNNLCTQAVVVVHKLSCSQKIHILYTKVTGAR